MTSLRLWLTDALAAEITAHAEREYPHEACGVLLGVGESARRVVPISNIAANPLHEYHMDERELARVIGGIDGLQVIAFYHTHPRGDALPSPVDVARAAYPTTPFLIVGLKDQRNPHFAAWLIDYTQVIRVELHIGDHPPTEAAPQPTTPAARIAILTSAGIAFILLIMLALTLLPPAPPIPR